MKKVYVVWYDNGGFGLDQYARIERIFETEKLAKEYILSKGFTKHKRHLFCGNQSDNWMRQNPDPYDEPYAFMEIREYILYTEEERNG